MQYLKICNNEFITLQDNIFTSLKNLKELDLSSNKLSILPDNIFEPLKTIEKINISNNYLTRIPSSIMKCLTLIPTKFGYHNNLLLDDPIATQFHHKIITMVYGERSIF
jgi:Leucine-rich repeat (LRR) protein